MKNGNFCIQCGYEVGGTRLLEVCVPKEQIRSLVMDTSSTNWHCDAQPVENTQDKGLSECILQDESSCDADAECVWCAEPIAGMCVTPDIAQKIGNLPFFKCNRKA
jgi:hypothetical protein